MARKDGAEQSYIPLGIFKLRIPFIHYRFETPEAIQAIFMCATCLGAIPVLTEYLGVPYEIAWSMVIINGALYFLHALLGDPVVPGWVTPAIPIVLAYLGNYQIGPDRIKAMVALQLIVGLIFFIMGVTGAANKLMKAIPASIQSGILLGAAIAAVEGEFKVGARFGLYPISICISGLLAYFLLFSSTFQAMRRKNAAIDAIGKYGMLPAIVLGIILGPLFKEISLPNIEIGTFIFIPKIDDVLNAVSPLRLGFPDVSLYIAAIPTAIAAYIIAFGDFITTDALIGEASKSRPDETVDFNANRSNLISSFRNFIMAIVAPYTQLCGPLWAAVTVSTAQRYKEGRSAMDSIFSGVGTFRLVTAISVSIIPVASLVRPVLPIALSITLLVQGYACTTLAMKMCKNETDMGIAGVMGAVLATKGAAWGLAVGIILHFLLSFNFEKRAGAK
ncbi:permease [Synergistales bacterium]|nr:permease [Synergistales bacterium]